MKIEDIYVTLRDLNYIDIQESIQTPPRPRPGTPVKYPRGRKNGPALARRAMSRTDTKENTNRPLVIPKQYTIQWDRNEIEAYVNAWQAKNHTVLHQGNLKWTPFPIPAIPKGSEDTDGEKEEASREPEHVDGDRSSITSTKATQNVSQTASPPKGPSSTVSVEDVEMTDSNEIKRSVRRSFRNNSREEENPFSAEPVRDSGSPRVLRGRRGRPRGRRTTRGTQPVQRRSLRSRRSDKVEQEAQEEEAQEEEEEENTDEDENGDPEAEDSDYASRGHESEPEQDAEGEDDDEVNDDDEEQEEQEEEDSPRRRTRASYRSEPPPPAETPRPVARKRRRVESPPSTIADADPEPSLSELTHESTPPHHSPTRSPSPIPEPPRRQTRANGRSNKTSSLNGVNGTIPRKTVTTRSDAQHQPFTSGTRLSSRINGAAPISPPRQGTLKESTVVNDSDGLRTRSSKPIKAEPLNDKDQNGHVDQQETEGESPGESLDKASQSVNGNCVVFNGTPMLYDDEDALGEEDAEGEEDPDLEDY